MERNSAKCAERLLFADVSSARRRVFSSQTCLQLADVSSARRRVFSSQTCLQPPASRFFIGPAPKQRNLPYLDLVELIVRQFNQVFTTGPRRRSASASDKFYAGMFMTTTNCQHR